MNATVIIKKDMFSMYPDEIHGLLYCYNGGTKVFVVDVNNCEIVAEFKVKMNSFHFYFDEDKRFFIVQGTDSKITIWQVNNYGEPYWQINLKGTVNSDYRFVCLDNTLYGFCDSNIKSQPATRYFAIDLLSREIKTELCPFFIGNRKNSVGGELHNAVETIYNDLLNHQLGKFRSLFSPLPDEYKSLYTLLPSVYHYNLKLCDLYYKTDKFGFLIFGDKLIAIPNGAELTEKMLGIKQAKKEKKRRIIPRNI